MRINAPQDRFEITFSSPDGNYVVRYEPVDDWDGRIAMSIRGVKVGGEVLSVEKGINGERVLMGATGGFKDLYDDEFWFELHPDTQPPSLSILVTAYCGGATNPFSCWTAIAPFAAAGNSRDVARYPSLTGCLRGLRSHDG